MKKSGFLLAVLTLSLAQSASLAMAAESKAGIQLVAANERYGCCLVKTDDKAVDVWEYQDDISFITCYKWAKLIGDPFQFLNNRKYEFYQNRKCSSMKDKHELIPAIWSLEYRNG